MDGPRFDPRAALIVRPAQRADVDRLLEIHVAAFPDPRPIEVRRRVFLHNRLGKLEDLRVAQCGEDLVGHAFSFPITVWLGGKEVKGRAIASVGVAVACRGLGIGSALLSAIHEEAHASDASFTLLYPFRQGYYARFGYAPLARQRVLTISPRAIPSSWRTAGEGRIRRATGSDRSEIMRVYREAGRRGNGFLERPERAWEEDLLEERQQWLVLEDSPGTLAGYTSCRLLQNEPHAIIRADVAELVATSDAGRRRLFAALGSLGDQVRDVTFAMADDDPLDWAFLDGDRDRSGTKEIEHAHGVVNTGPMMRLVSPERVLLGRGYTSEGTVALAVGEAPAFLLTVRGGSATIEYSTDAGRDPLTLASSALAAIACGGLRVEDAVRLGWASGSAKTIDSAARLLKIPAFFSVDQF